MNANQGGQHVSELVRTHERAASPRSKPQGLESFAMMSRYQRGQMVYQKESSVECWYRIISGAARRFVIRVDGRRQIVDLLLPGDMFGFGLRANHSFTAEAINTDTLVARYPLSQIEAFATSDNPCAVRELHGILCGAASRLYALSLILGRTTAEEKVGAFLLHMQERVAGSATDRFALPISRYDIADYLALSVETVSRSLTRLKRRGHIALSGRRQIDIIHSETLAGECDAGEGIAELPATDRSAFGRVTDLPVRSVEVRARAFAFADVLSEMRQWLERQHCNPSRFSCIRDGSGAVIIQVEFTNESEAVACAFERQFAASTTASG